MAEEIPDYLGEIILAAGAANNEFKRLKVQYLNCADDHREAWGLIDKMMPWVEKAGSLAKESRDDIRLLIEEVEQKRKLHG